MRRSAELAAALAVLGELITPVEEHGGYLVKRRAVPRGRVGWRQGALVRSRSRAARGRGAGGAAARHSAGRDRRGHRARAGLAVRGGAPRRRASYDPSWSARSSSALSCSRYGRGTTRSSALALASRPQRAAGWRSRSECAEAVAPDRAASARARRGAGGSSSPSGRACPWRASWRGGGQLGVLGVMVGASLRAAPKWARAVGAPARGSCTAACVSAGGARADRHIELRPIYEAGRSRSRGRVLFWIVGRRDHGRCLAAVQRWCGSIRSGTPLTRTSAGATGRRQHRGRSASTARCWCASRARHRGRAPLAGRAHRARRAARSSWVTGGKADHDRPAAGGGGVR